MKIDSKTLQKATAALSAVLGVFVMYGILSPDYACAAASVIAAVAAVWEPAPTP